MEEAKIVSPNPPTPVQSQPVHAQMQPPALLPESARRGRTPPPPEPSPVPSDMGPPALSQMPPGTRESFSDVSVIEVSEARPQPVLRPHVIQVHRRPSDLHEDMQTTPTQPPLQRPPPSSIPNERPVSRETVSSTFSLPSQRQNARPDPPQDDPERSLTPAPLFSKPNSPASSSKSGVASPPPLRSPQAKQFEPPPLAPKSPPRRLPWMTSGRRSQWWITRAETGATMMIGIIDSNVKRARPFHLIPHSIVDLALARDLVHDHGSRLLIYTPCRVGWTRLTPDINKP